MDMEGHPADCQCLTCMNRKAGSGLLRPDAAPPKDDVFEVCSDPVDDETYRIITGEPAPSDAAQPEDEMRDICSTCGTLMKVVEDGEGVFHYAPSDAAPVAWRWRIEGETGDWRYCNRPPAAKRHIVVQPLYEDAPRPDKESECRGPYRALPSDRKGDKRWMVSHESENVGCIYGTKGECEDIRDVLNRHATDGSRSGQVEDAQPDDEHREFWLRWCRDFFIIESGSAGPHVPWLNELLQSHPEDAPGGPTRLDVERVLASMLSVIHTLHGDVAWTIYRDNAPELADYRAFVNRLKGETDG